MIVTEAMVALQDAGFVVDERRLPKGGIIGGLSREDSRLGPKDEDVIWVYQHSFHIWPEPEEGGYMPRVSGPGQRTTEGEASSLEDAVEFIISVYRERGQISPR